MFLSSVMDALAIPPVLDAAAARALEIPGLDIAGVCAVVDALDGSRTFAQVQVQVAIRAFDVEAAAVAALIRELSDRGLLGEPPWEDLPTQTLGDARYACLACGVGCQQMEIGPLSDRDLERLRSVDLALLGTPLTDAIAEIETSEGTRPFLAKKDGACVFLDRATMRCRIHSEYGSKTKPLACQVFPSSLFYVPGSQRLSLRPSCVKRHVTRTSGSVQSDASAWVAEMRELGWGRTSPFPRWVLYLPELAAVSLAPDFSLPFEEYVELESQVLDALQSRTGSAEEVLAGVLPELLAIVTGGRSAKEIPADASKLGRRNLGRFCELLLESTHEGPLVASAIESVRATVSSGRSLPTLRELAGGDATVEDLAVDFLANEIWSLETIRQSGFVVPGIVLLTFTYILSKQYAADLAASRGDEFVSGADFNLAFALVDDVFKRLKLSDPRPLLAFALSPLV